MDKEPINRLILIGNGFDLAHGLKTRYNDFILWYMRTSFEKADADGVYEDVLMKVEREKNIQISYGKIKNITDYIQHFYERGFIGLESDRIGFGDALNTTYNNSFRVKILSSFFRELLAKCAISTWVEIENEYYSFLKKQLDSDKRDKIEGILNRLHTRFAFIIEQLDLYLKTISTPKPIAGYNDIFDSNINEMDIVNTKKISGSRLPAQTMILNFNYTPTLLPYFGSNEKLITHENRKVINHIHGELDKNDNPIIFGFGDELDKAYEKMELETTKGFFSFIKSFWYFKTSNYHNLIRFIDSTEFQVVILGHSCGLSDRTMLNMIFEHDNCISVKIYYHGDQQKNNYTEITQDISRHFRNKPQMRRKIVPFDKSEPMPQYIPSTEAPSSAI